MGRPPDREKQTNFSRAGRYEQEPDDADLARGCLAGDREACGTLLSRYERVVFNAALRLVRHRDEARDIAQAALVRAFERLEGYDPRQRFGPWIARIAMNEAHDALARRRRTEPIDEGLPSEERSPEGTAGVDELRERLDEALMTLTLDQRLVVILRHFMDCTYDDMADILDVPVKTVKSRLFTARHLLRDRLAARGIRTC